MWRMSESYGQHGTTDVYQPGTGEAAELLARIQAAVEPTPYRFDRTEDGFEITVDVPSQQWRGFLYSRRTDRVFTHRVQVVEQARKLKITDSVATVTWVMGANGPNPQLGVSKRLGSGRVIHFSFQKTVGQESPTDFTFSSEEGRHLITRPAEQLGWRIAWGRNALIGLVMGCIGGAGALAALIGVLVAKLTGNL